MRLVGQTSDESFPPEGGLRGGGGDFDAAATWLRERLEATRSTTSIAMLCLDAEGGVCSWVTSPSTDPSVVSASVRLGTADGSRAGGGAFDFYAPSESESSLEALGPRTGKPAAGVLPPRLAVLGIADVPGRLLVDALDRQGVAVEQASTLWHAMAVAWDPGAPRTGSVNAEAPADSPITAIVLIDPLGRLLWCWSRGGTLLVAGSLRLRMRRAEQGEAGPDLPEYGVEDASRLAAEWLSWSVQLARSPRRIVCVLTPSDDAAAFGEALGGAWPGAPVDAVRHEDPLGVTLRRLADLIESTPRAAAAGEAATTLPALSRRAGRSHRRMHYWRAAALLGVAVVLGMGAWQFQSAAGEATDSAKQWESRWREVIKEAYPEMPTVLGESSSPLVLLNEEVKRRERDLRPVERSDQTMPILQELDTISLVLGSAQCDLEEITLDSTLRPRVSTIVRSAEQAEAILEGFRRIGGSFVTNWSLTGSERPQGTEQRIRALYQGEWNRDALKPEAGGSR
ncbi:hypothetical protein PHYC_03285 [Phycisphaerales bacterium]|nr:hypothetical protein PHYC_03285 [Phycisphaerales bacterium]